MFALIIFAIVGLVIAVLAFAVYKAFRRPQVAIANLATIASEVNFSDGIDKREWEIIRKVVSDHKQAGT